MVLRSKYGLSKKPKRKGVGSSVKFLGNLSNLTILQTIAIWQTALTILADRQKSWLFSDAKQVIDAIGKEWARRSLMPFVPSDCFNWSTTEAPTGIGVLSTVGWFEEEMFKLLGYQVGRLAGRPKAIRRAILAEMYQSILPPILPPEHMREWGSPKSAKRLNKIAEAIASFARDAKRHNGRLDEAIQEWESDLKFLYDKYYAGHFQFTFPTTAIK